MPLVVSACVFGAQAKAVLDVALLMDLPELFAQSHFVSIESSGDLVPMLKLSNSLFVFNVVNKVQIDR
jgi:hypothetical protein